MKSPSRLSGAARVLVPLLLASAPRGQTAAFRVLDRVEGDWITLNTVPVRPMALAADGRTLFALNQHGSRVVRFDLLTFQQTGTFDVPWGPASVALWFQPQLAREVLLVACQGTHALVMVDPLTRRTLRLLELPSEPADLLVDTASARAFVSCSGANAVVEVRLPSFTVARVYDGASHPELRLVHPLFLSFDAGGKVLVAPMLSGNDSTSSRLTPGFGRQAGETVLDLTDPAIVPDPATDSLPDEDLFRIDPVAGTVEVVATGLGTVLFAHGTHPSTGDVWVLNTEANNKDPGRQSAAGVRGFAVDNRISIATLGAGRVEPHTIVNVDDASPAQPGVQYDPAISVGQPYALAFSSSGFAYVAGLLTDNVSVFNAQGTRVRQWKVADGAIPRGLLFAGDRLLVYAWGNNTIEVWTPLAPQPDAVLDLGHDPAPDAVRAGRTLFYDASNSLNGNTSCASCHIEGRSDLLVWNLSEQPADDKGPMLTQTLAGLGKLAPFHWRGERRGFRDFNAGFDALLGGTPLGPGDLEAFEAFVLAIQNPANPAEDDERVLNDAIQPPELPSGVSSASAIRGQDLFFDAPTFGSFRCNDCHALPTGTMHDIVMDDAVMARPKRAAFKIPPFHELWRRQQPRVEIELWVDPKDPGQGTVKDKRALLGAGLTHAGLIPTLFDFVAEFGLDDQDHADLFAFLHQLDQGLAPAVHRAWLLTPFDVGTAAEIADYLLPQAQAGQCDIAVYGSAPTTQTGGTLRWYWDRADEVFRSESVRVSPRALDDFLALASGQWYVFLGFPVGAARRFAVDYDGDLLFNRDEPPEGADPLDPDSDDDGFPDGHEIAHGADPADPQSVPNDQVPPAIEGLALEWITSKVARVSWTTDEPTVWRIEAQDSEGGTVCVPDPDDCQATSERPATTHSALLTGLLPSTAGGATLTYDVRVLAIDPGGNTTELLVPGPVETEAFITDNSLAGEVVVASLGWTLLDRDVQGLVLHASADASIALKRGGPPPIPARARAVVATVLVDGAKSADFTPAGGATYKVHGVRVTSGGQNPHTLEVDGPFLVSLESDGNGETSLAFDQPLPAADSRVTLNVEAVIWVSDTVAFLGELEEAEACVLGGGPFDCDLDGDTVPESCCVEVPVEFAPRGLTKWSFPDTPAEARAISDPE